ELAERVIEMSGMLPKLCGRILGRFRDKRGKARRSLLSAHQAFELAQCLCDDHGRDRLRPATRRTAVAEQAYTRQNCCQQGHAMQGNMVLEHLLQHRIRGGFLRGGECGHELSVLSTPYCPDDLAP